MPTTRMSLSAEPLAPPPAVHGSAFSVIHPRETWQRIPVRLANPGDFRVDANYYVIPKQVETTGAP